MDNYDHDPYLIPTVPRWKKNLFSQDLDESIGDKFFELNFGSSLFSPKFEAKNLSPEPIEISGLIPLASKKENIPPRQSISQSSMRLRSSVSKNELDTNSLPIAQRTRRSRSFIKPNRPSIDAYNSIEPSKPPASSVAATVKGSIFSTKPKENLNVNGQAPVNSRRFRSLIKPSRPSVGSIPIASIEKTVSVEKTASIKKNAPIEKNTPIETPNKKTTSVEKIPLKVSKTLLTAQKTSVTASKTVIQKVSSSNSKILNDTPKQLSKFAITINKPLTTSTITSKFLSKPRDSFKQLPACTPTSKRRSSYMAPTIASAQRGQGASLRKQ